MNTNKPTVNYKTRILAVDDEVTILLGLEQQLAARGYEVKTASDGWQALKEIEAFSPNLIILDLMMPGIDGLAIIQEVRFTLHKTTPILVLSARGDEQKKVEALDLGADDYLTKPFGVDELLARIRVALRHRPSNPAQEPPINILGNEHLKIDLNEHLVFKDGKELKLSPKQFELLKYLAVNPGRLITHRMLLQHVWGPEYESETQYVHVYIGQLRHKIESDQSKPRYIVTEPGLGYRFYLPDTIPNPEE
jgi:two-component system KDP operon response regulator KdpE